MTRYLLDTNIVTELEDRSRPGFSAIYSKLCSLSDEDDVCLSILSAYEYRHGIAKAPPDLKASLLKVWADFEQRFPLLGLSSEGAVIFGDIKSKYQVHTGSANRQLKKHTVDFMLASSAISHEAVLVSDDRIFSVIQEIYPVLQVENWLLVSPDGQ